MLSQSYPPVIGGEERHVWSLSRSLAARGHEVVVVTLATEGVAEFEVEGGVRIYRLRSTLHRAPWLFREEGRVHAPPLPDPKISWALRHIVDEEETQIVHAHNWLVHSYLPLKRVGGPKLVLSVHDYSLRCATKKLLRRGVICSGPGVMKCPGCAIEHYGQAKGISTLVANAGSSLVERHLVDMFLPVSHAVAAGNGLLQDTVPVRVIPNFFTEHTDTSEAAIEPYVSQLPHEPYLLFVGAFAAYKGIDVLLSAYAGLRDAPPLVIVGYDTAEYRVTTSHLPPRVTIARNWPHRAVMEAWRRSLFGLVPAIWNEPFGLVVLEAMSTGRPVIASTVGGLPEIVHHRESGLLVSPGDPLSLRNAMQQMLYEPGLREALSCGARQRAAEFEEGVVVPRVEEVYADLLRARTSLDE